jgi:hypothetical protein
MGELYLAEDIKLGRQVALKLASETAQKQLVFGGGPGGVDDRSRSNIQLVDLRTGKTTPLPQYGVIRKGVPARTWNLSALRHKARRARRAHVPTGHRRCGRRGDSGIHRRDLVVMLKPHVDALSGEWSRHLSIVQYRCTVRQLHLPSTKPAETVLKLWNQAGELGRRERLVHVGNHLPEVIHQHQVGFGLVPFDVHEEALIATHADGWRRL